MATRASTWFKTQVLDQWFRGAAVSVPTTLYLALYVEDPGPDNAGAEVSGGDYARVAIDSDDDSWSAPEAAGDNHRIDNLLALEFPNPSGADWGIATYWGLLTAATGGELLIYGDLVAPRQILDGDLPPTVPAGMLGVEMG